MSHRAARTAPRARSSPGALPALLAHRIGFACWLALIAAPTPSLAAPPRCTVRVRPGADLQRTVDELPKNDPPPTVCLVAGEFRLPRFLSLTQDGLRLRGEGPATVLRLDDGVESPVIVIGDHAHQVPARVVSHVTVERLRIIGGGRAGRESDPEYPYLQNSAVAVRAGRDIALRDLEIGACRSACLLTEHDSRDVTIERDTISGSTWDGVSLNRTVRARLVGNTIRDNTAAGITAEHLEDSVLEGNVIGGNRSQGVYLADSYRNRFSGNRFIDNVNAGVFLTCAVRYRDPGPVLCWVDSMSQGNIFEANEFRGNRLAYIVAPDAAANCRKGSVVQNVSRGDRFASGPRVEQQRDDYGPCLRLEERAGDGDEPAHSPASQTFAIAAPHDTPCFRPIPLE